MGGACSSTTKVEKGSQKIAQNASRGGKTQTFLHLRVNIYEIVGTTTHVFISEMKAGTAYVTGVEVGGLEYFYGWCKEGSGLWCCVPTQLPQESAWSRAIYRQTVDMGMLMAQNDELEAIMNEMHAKYTGEAFDPLEHNWNNFVGDLCKRLTDETVPRCWATLGEECAAAPKMKKKYGIMKEDCSKEWLCPAERKPPTERVALKNRTLKKSSSEVQFMEMMREEEKGAKEEAALALAKEKMGGVKGEPA